MKTLVLVVILVMGAMGPATASASTLVVNQSTPACTIGTGNYSSIAAAISSSSNGDEIVVCPGWYTRNLVLNKSVNLTGFSKDASDTIINASNPGTYVIYVTASSANISFFTIANTTGSNDHAVFLQNVAHSNISYNIFNDIKRGGVGIVSSTGKFNYIGHNTFEDTCAIQSTDGHLLLTGTGAQNTLVEFNTFNMGQSAGTSWPYITFSTDSDNHVFRNNLFTGFGGASSNGAIRILNGASNNTFTNNTFQDINRTYIFETGGAGTGNQIYNNFFNISAGTFFKPGGVAVDLNTTLSAATNRIGGPFTGGNFWGYRNGSGFSDTCTYSYRTGICDTNYTISSDYIDYLPLTISKPASIFVTDLNVSDFQLASSTYVSIHNDTINVSITRKFGLFNFMVANKMGSGGLNLLTMRVLIDGVSACEKDLATLNTVNEYGGIAGCLVDFVLTPGSHSLTFQAKRSGSGTVDITNYKAILYAHQSNANSNISDTSVTTGNLTTFNTSFNPILNINVNKTSSSRTFHYVKITVESNDTETADFYLNDTVSGEVSPFVSSYIADDTAKVSVFIPWASNNDETSHILKLYVRSRGGQLINVSNITVHNIDLKDALGNVVNATEITNVTTNLSRGRLIGASTTETLLQRTIRVVNGTSLWIAWSATINSSQKTSPIVETFIVGQPHSTCFGRVRETLVTGGTNGNIFDMIVCSNLTPGNSYLVTFNVTTESGKPIRILDEMVTIVEGVTLNISEQNLAPLPNTIIAPANGSTVTQPINVTWRNFTDPDGDAVTYNVTLWNSSGFIRTISDNLNDNLTLFDITGVPDSTYIIKVEGCDPLLLCSHSNSSFTIDTSPITIDTSPLAPLLRLISNAKAQASTILTEVSQFIVLALYLILAAIAGLLLSLFANMMLKGG